jgi:hypothetical protein
MRGCGSYWKPQMSTATRHFSSSFVLIIAGERVSEEAKQSKAKRGKQASKQASSPPASQRRRVVHRNPEFQAALRSCDFVLGRWVFFYPTQ